MNKKNISLILILVVLLILPFVASDYYLHIGIMALMYAFLSQSWNIMSGYSGQFSFGHAAFFGIGAYISSTLFIKYEISPWIGMFAGAAISLLVGLLIGFLTFRYKLKGFYFALATLAFAEIVRTIVQNTEYFNGTLGIMVPLNSDPLLFQFSSRIGYFYVILIMVILITLLVHKISKSKLGFSLVSIRENEDAAKSLGVNTYKYKMIAVALSSGLTALGGTFYAQYLLIIEPTAVFASQMSVAILLPAILGGAGTVLGPVIGSFIITPLGEFTTAFFSGVTGLQFVIYGLILMVAILYLPNGVVGLFQNSKLKREIKTEENVK